ncbi:energy transducer TonB [Aureispira anguillae]|uniref:Energy transducer TonB n=1 Tax=Aureispira anguillae TaxID=2864201 RepID=A0A916DT97_9BACT|nr:energy transducer TonB [Aureispira anguillae]BDS11607.1 energy transducer TonB [Aureispira anguillae]
MKRYQLFILFITCFFLFYKNATAQNKPNKTLTEENKKSKKYLNSIDFLSISSLLQEIQQLHHQKNIAAAKDSLTAVHQLIKQQKTKLLAPSLKRIQEDSIEQLKQINRYLSDYYLASWLQLVLEEKPSIGQDFLRKNKWFKLSIEVGKFSNIFQLLKLSDQYYGSTSEIYLKNWKAAYINCALEPLYYKQAEELWLQLIACRVQKFGMESKEHLDVLFGLSNFYNRIKNATAYQQIRTQVEQQWPAAYELEKVKNTTTAAPLPPIEEAPIITTCEVEMDEEKEIEDVEIKNIEETATTTDHLPPVFVVVEQMPRFPGCESETSLLMEKKRCSDQTLLSYMYTHFNYSDIPRKDGMGGISIINFIVTEHGTIVNAQIIRNTGGDPIGEESLRIIQFMNELPRRWTPGKDKGKPVRVKLNLPFRINLK